MGDDGAIWRRLRDSSRIASLLAAIRGRGSERARKPQFDGARFKGPFVRPDKDEFVLNAKDAVPSRRIAAEIDAGTAFFDKHGFLFDLKGSPLNGAAAAVRDLSREPPQALRTDAIEPDVSIIIPIYGQLHFALNCLNSLAAQNSRFSVEIIVVDDASPPETQTQRLADIPWINYVRRKTNAGFLGTCNEAAASARGRYVVFLNSDTRVVRDWLDELIGTFALFPKAGFVGSKLYNDDGSLQEAGGIFWRDGSAWNYGRDDDGDHPKYCFARRVDYCSGAAIAVSRAAWESANGFDPIFRPAYCEDADIAFRLRDSGFEIWFQPLSCVVHYEGRTHGRDLKSGIKAHQVTNMQRFSARWKETLRTHRPEAVEPAREADRFAQKRILVLDAESPMPDRNCGSVIVAALLKALADLGYSITFVPQENYYHDGRYTADLQRRGIECLYEPFFYNIDDISTFRDDFDYVLAFRYYVVHPIFETLHKRLPRTPVIFSNVDLHYLREQRQAELHACRRGRMAAMVTKAKELETFCRADCSLVHTEDEANIIRQHLPLDNIIVLPYIAESARSEVGFEERHDIMFLGGFSHVPNVDAMMHFVETVWPSLIETLPPTANLLIVGSSPPVEVQKLAGDRITVTGFVEDLKPWFDAARVFVAPLRFGAGIKGKVIESLRYGTPCVVTPIAAEGIGLTSERDVLIADLNDDFATTIMRLYDNPTLWSGLQQNGYQLVDERFSAQQCRDICVEMLDKADASWIAREERALTRRLQSISAR